MPDPGRHPSAETAHAGPVPSVQARQARLVQALHAEVIVVWLAPIASAAPWAPRLSAETAPETGGRSSC